MHVWRRCAEPYTPIWVLLHGIVLAAAAWNAAAGENVSNTVQAGLANTPAYFLAAADAIDVHVQS